MRWPFGPPHLTLKPSKKKQNKKQKQKLNPPKKAPKNKKTKKQKKQKKKKKSNKTQKYQKKSISVISQNFLCFGGGGVQKLPFLTTWPRKRAPPKHYKNRGFSLFFEKRYASRNGHFWTKKPKSRNSSYHFFFAFFLFQQQKTPKLAETPIFIVL